MCVEYISDFEELCWRTLKRSSSWRSPRTKSGKEKTKHNQLLCMVKGLGYMPTYSIAGMYELYVQLLPTKLYTKEKAQTYTDGEVLCRLCGKVAERVAHVLAGCSSLAQTKYLYRHNATLKILFFELLREHGLIEEVPPWYSPVMPKPAYQNTTSEVFWDIPIYAEHNEVKANRIDAGLVSHERKEVCTTEMSCP